MNKKLLAFTAVALAILVYACKKNPMDIADDLSLRIGTEIFEYTVQGTVVDDADWSKPISDIKVFVEGDYAEYAYDATSGKKEISVTDGKFSIGIDPKVRPVTGEPIVLSVLIMANGYISQSENVVITEKDNLKEYRAGLINYNNPPDYLDIEVENVTLSGGTVTQDMTFKGKNSAADSVYFDDGLTTVVLTKGTRFYYYNYQKTGTALRPASYLTVIDTIIVNGKKAFVKRNVVESFDTVDVFGYVKTYYSGSELEIQAYYSKGTDIDMRIHHNSTWDNQEFDVLAETQKVAHKNLLFTSIVKKRLYYLTFQGEDPSGKPINLYPENEPGKPRWFTSYVIDEAAINPLTNAAVKEGDSIEVGVDYDNKKTKREIILKASNGQLRAQTQDVNVGFYEQALHSLDVDFTWNISVDEEIPDRENLRAWTNINLSNKYSYWNYFSGYYTGQRRVSYTVSSKEKLNATGEIESIYCGTLVEDLSGLANNGTYNVFNYSKIKNIFPDKVSFDISLMCPDGKVVVKPSYYGSFYGDGRYYYMHMRDGQWATRGVKLGKPYRLYGGANGSYIDTTLALDENHYKIDFLLKGSNDLCK